MSLKIDVSKIIKDHINTISNANGGGSTGWDYVSFLITPLIFASGLLMLDLYFTVEFVNIVVSGLSIFVGLLFNIIVILFDIVKTDKISMDKQDLIKEVVINISFCILISLLAIVTSLTTQLPWGCVFKNSTNFVTYFIIAEFLLTLLMILKRMYHIFITEIDGIIKNNK